MRTIVPYTSGKVGGMSVRNQLVKSIEYHQSLTMMYINKDGVISKRRIKVRQVGDNSFRAYCSLRRSNRTFTIDNVLALVPVVNRERDVI